MWFTYPSKLLCSVPLYIALWMASIRGKSANRKTREPQATMLLANFDKGKQPGIYWCLDLLEDVASYYYIRVWTHLIHHNLGLDRFFQGPFQKKVACFQQLGTNPQFQGVFQTGSQGKIGTRNQPKTPEFLKGDGVTCIHAANGWNIQIHDITKNWNISLQFHSHIGLLGLILTQSKCWMLIILLHVWHLFNIVVGCL